MKSGKIAELDAFDNKILAILANEGRLTITELASRVGLSTSPCQVRLKRLIEEDYILGFRALLNPAKMEMEHIAFTMVELSNTTEQGLDDFNREVMKIPEVETCHMTAASFDYLLKVRTRDIQAYRRVLGEAISRLPHVASTSTYVAMESVKDIFS